MKYKVQRSFSNLNLGLAYRDFDDILGKLICEMRDRVGHSFIGEYNNLRFVMNIPFYSEFFIACQMAGKNSEWCRGVKITLNRNLYINDPSSPIGIVQLIYEESGATQFKEELELKKLYKKYCVEDAKASYQCWRNFLRSSSAVPHIDHVKFNSPATIVFWKDGTKTVVKHDGKGRKDKRMAVLYAFMRKIYGEGKSYHNILNEIEEAIK